MAERVKTLTGRLPKSVGTALAIRGKVHAAQTKVSPADTTAAFEELAYGIGTTGNVPDDLADRTAAIAAVSAANAVAERVLDRAVETADKAASAAIAAAADDLLAALRQSLADTLDEIRAVGTPIAALSLADPLSLPEDRLIAFRRVRDLGEHVAEIRATHAALGRATFGVYPDDGIGFGWLENAAEVWGSSIDGRHMNPGAQPWPTGDAAELALWLAGIAPSYIAAMPIPWLPRPDEAHAVYGAFIADRTGTPVPA